MELFKKFGFWAMVVLLLTPVMLGASLLFKNFEGEVYFFSAFFFPVVTLILSVIGLVKDKSKKLARFSLIVSGLYLFILLCFALTKITASKPGPSAWCAGIGGQCYSGTSCSEIQTPLSEGAYWGENVAYNGLRGGCKENEFCCIPLEILPTE